MSECKKTCGNCAGLIRSVLSKDRCDMTNKPIENYSSTCKDWEPNRDTEVVMQKDELKSLRKERDALKAQVKERELAIEKVEAKCCQCHVEHVAQVAVLRGALEEINKVSTEQGLSMLDGACKVDKLACEALDSTPAEAAESVNALVGALKRIEKSGTGTLDGVVVLTQEAKLARQALAEWRKNQ